MEPMRREGLEQLRSLLADRIGAPYERMVRPRAGRSRCVLRHATTAVDAYLSAVEAGNCTAVGLREQALDLWQGLERIASAWPRPGTLAGEARCALAA